MTTISEKPKSNNYPTERKSRVLQESLTAEEVSKLILEAASLGIQKASKQIKKAKYDVNENHRNAKALECYQLIRHRELSLHRELEKIDLDIEIKRKQVGALSDLSDEQLAQQLKQAVKELKLVD